MEIDLFSLPRRAASSLPPFPEFLSKLAAAELVYAIEKVRHPTGFFYCSWRSKTAVKLRRRFPSPRGAVLFYCLASPLSLYLKE
ncbi:MAG: hypothetical protein IKB35_04255, partial [Clostridia bacterium]|nr:hypothetical protein [Clostridia bacterium]